MQRSALCRSRRELSNAYFLAKFGFDTAENEPCQVCPTEQCSRSRQALEPELLANLRHALETAGGGAEIVLSSSWRRVPKMVEILCQQLEAAGCPVPVGVTESILRSEVNNFEK